MAFEAYRAQEKARPRRGRRLTYALSIAFHGALVVAGVAYSYWHVDELTPPALHVTLVSSTAPPPPPPPAAAGGGPKQKAAPRPRTPTTTVQPTALVEPRDTPKPLDQRPVDDDDDPDEPGGIRGGSKGGTIGGTPGGTIGGKPGGVVGGKVGATGAARSLAPDLGALRKISGADPDFPVQLRKSGAVYTVLARIWVSPAGDVSDVTILSHGDPLLAASVVKTVKTWRFRPLSDNGLPVPFSYVATFQFNGQ